MPSIAYTMTICPIIFLGFDIFDRQKNRRKQTSDGPTEIRPHFLYPDGESIPDPLAGSAHYPEWIIHSSRGDLPAWKEASRMDLTHIVRDCMEKLERSQKFTMAR